MTSAGANASGRTLIGLASGPSVRGFVERHPGLIDYLEVPFELLRHNPATLSLSELAPIVLHCASMSVAGFVPPSEDTLCAIADEIERTGTPWIGEHLAFITADPLQRGAALHDATTLTYTVCPQLSEEVIEHACRSLTALQARFPVPLIVENSPQYFSIPGSTMSIVDFTIEVHRRSGAGMLLDLTHFMISSINMGFDPRKEIARLPLEHLVELHVSGHDEQSGTAWDDHAGLADEATFALVEAVLERARPKAVTFEYNWAPDVPDDVFVDHIARMRGMLAHA